MLTYVKQHMFARRLTPLAFEEHRRGNLFTIRDTVYKPACPFSILATGTVFAWSGVCDANRQHQAKRQKRSRKRM